MSDFTNDSIYNKYSEHLNIMYGTKVYKLPINIPVSCPNRSLENFGPCAFCGDSGAGFENLSNQLSVQEQISMNMEKIKAKYKANKFIAYFQNFTNTYTDLKSFEKFVSGAIMEDIVEICISTRPDCIRKEYLDFLQSIKRKHNINITVELGLQTVNYHTLESMQRGHTLAEYIDAVDLLKQYHITICTHVILNLPGDSMLDVVETAKIVSALKTHQVKIHALFIAKGSELARRYEKNEFEISSLEEYKERVITFLEYLSPNIVIQRIIGRIPEEDCLFANWGTSWWKIRDDIENQMREQGRLQGNKFGYLGGAAVKDFFV